MVLRQMVARSVSRLAKLCTGIAAGVCLVAALASAVGERAAAAPGLCRASWAAGLVVVGEQDGREPGLHVPGDVVRDHPQEHVRAEPVLGPVPDRPDVQVGVERAEGPLDLGQGLVGGDDLGGFQVTGLDAGAQYVDAVQGGLGGDEVLVPGVTEVDRR